MTSRELRRFFCPARSAALGAALSIGLSACASATIEDAVPVSAATGLPAGPVNTGTYPDLNVAPGAAAAQLTPEEQQSKTGELAAAKARVQSQPSESPAAASATRAELEARKTRGDEVLKEIEGEAASN